MVEIPIVRVEASIHDSQSVARAGSVEVTVTEPMEPGEGVSPLELFLMGLASCEASMFRIIAGRMGIGFESVRVVVEGEFSLGEGLRRLKITYIVGGGVDYSRVIEQVRRLCPVYNTLRKAGVNIEEEVVAG